MNNFWLMAFRFALMVLLLPSPVVPRTWLMSLVCVTVSFVLVAVLLVLVWIVESVPFASASTTAHWACADGAASPRTSKKVAPPSRRRMAVLARLRKFGCVAMGVSIVNALSARRRTGGTRSGGRRGRLLATSLAILIETGQPLVWHQIICSRAVLFRLPRKHFMHDLYVVSRRRDDGERVIHAAQVELAYSRSVPLLDEEAT